MKVLTHVWEQEAASSSLATPTRIKISRTMPVNWLARLIFCIYELEKINKKYKIIVSHTLQITLHKYLIKSIRRIIGQSMISDYFLYSSNMNLTLVTASISRLCWNS